MVNEHSYSFHSSVGGEGHDIVMLLLFSEHEHLISISCTFNYHKYLFRQENSSLIHFKYYKSCLMSNSIQCSVDESTITLVMRDSSDVQQSVKFVLEKQKRDHEEKLDIMFEAMINEIRELKEQLWYSDRKLNKFSEKFISNWNDLLNQLNRSQTNNNEVSIRKNGSYPNYVNTYSVNINGLTKNQYVQQNLFEYREEGLEPIIIYFKHAVEFSRVEFSIESESIKVDDSKVKVFVYGIMKPKGIIRKVGSTTESQNNDKQEFFLMPSLTLLKEQEYLEKQVSITFESQQPYDGVGIAVRLNHLSAQNQQIIRTYQHFSYSLSKVRIF